MGYSNYYGRDFYSMENGGNNDCDNDDRGIPNNYCSTLEPKDSSMEGNNPNTMANDTLHKTEKTKLLLQAMHLP